MPNGVPLPANIEQARTGAEAATKTAGQYASGQYTIGDILKQKTIDAYGASQDIVKPLDVATQDYLQAPGVAREKYQDIFNPFAREQLVSQYTGNQALPMLSLASILGQRFGRVEDTIGAGTRAYQAQGAQALGQAGLERQGYQDLLGQYQMQQQQEQQAWERPYQERLWEKELGKPYYKPGGEGGMDSATQILLNWMANQQQETTTPTPTESKPMFTPPKMGAISKGGEWYFIGSEHYPDDWIPIVD